MIERTIAGHDPKVPLHGRMRIVKTGEICEYLDEGTPNIIKVKTMDGNIGEFPRIELEDIP
jgi:hypothetical protein